MDEVIDWLGFYISTRLHQTLGYGNHITPLNSKVIAKAAAKVPNEPSRESPPWQMARTESPAPVVIVKKRRVGVMP